MIIIPVKNEKSLEQALKQYKFKVSKTKQIQQLQERKEFVKPSVIKREEKKKAQYKQKNQISS
jgi:small subunit ribosomal protein S21